MTEHIGIRQLSRRLFLGSCAAVIPAVACARARHVVRADGTPRETRTFTAHDITHEIVMLGSGPDVILLHEITGADEVFFAFANKLAGLGYRVHCPVLFGQSGGYEASHNQLNYLRTCATYHELACLRSSAENPLNPWLCALADDIGGSASTPVGAIGMCLTGIQPLAMLRSRAVVAPAICQPALPLSTGGARAQDLGLPKADVDLAVSRVEHDDLKVLALRYSADTTSPAARLERLKGLFGDRLDYRPLDSTGLHRPHSTLVFPASPASFDIAFSRLQEFLHDRLAAKVRV